MGLAHRDNHPGRRRLYLDHQLGWRRRRKRRDDDLAPASQVAALVKMGKQGVIPQMRGVKFSPRFFDVTGK